jgi:enoyl-CoA hydratase
VGDYVRLEHEGPITVLVIDRPERLNALDAGVLDALRAAVEETAARDGARALIITGAGKAFVAGADIEAMKDMDGDAARAFSEAGHRTLDLIEELPCPVIAAVNGFALGGGCELALACDFIFASDKARFGQPEVKLGVIPGFGGTQRLMRRVGAARARELVYTGRMVSADEAARIGLVNAVFAPDRLLEEAKKTAAEIAAVGPLAVAAAKRVMLEGEGRLLAEANRREIDAFAGCFSTDDQREGMDAFLEKRAASFKGR